MLTVHVRTAYLQHFPHATYVGFIKCHTHGGVEWIESTGVHRLTRADAREDARQLVARYHAISHNAAEE